MIKSSTLRCSFGSIQSSGLNLPSDREPRGMKHATWQLRSLTSNSSTLRAPFSPAIRRCQLASTPQPSGVTRPSPVMTTRRGIRMLCIVGIWRGLVGRGVSRAQSNSERPRPEKKLGRARVLLEEFHGVADGLDLLGGVIGNFAAEFLLEGHYQLDRIEAIGTQIINKARAVGDLVGLDPEVLHHDLLHARCDVAHCSIPWLFADPRCCRVPKTGPGQAHARNCAMAREDSRPDSRHFLG